MRTEYSNNDLKVHYELLEKVNSELPDVVIGAMLAVHTVLDILFFLDFITEEEFHNAYVPGDTNE